jgi:hypothetical protein
MDFCARCGQQAQPGQPFCPRCGLALSSQPPGFPPRYRWMAAAGIVVAGVAAGAIVAMFMVRSPAAHTSASSLASALSQSPVRGAASQTATSQAVAGAVSEQEAAQNLSRLLTQSISDRSAIVSAYNDVDTCGAGLAADAQTFEQAVTSRQKLLAQLGALPGANALPSPMLQALTGAWQASVDADREYAAWARDESMHGCRAHDTANAHYQATSAPNQAATTDKTSFVGRWNPIATTYGLPTYQHSEL